MSCITTAPTGEGGVYDELDREWRRLCASPEAAGALRRWSQDSALSGVSSLDGILDRRAGGDRATADRVLAALAARASTDRVAARTLLQALVPGLIRLSGRLARLPRTTWLDATPTTAEMDQELVALAYLRIADYPYQRRPRCIAANILLDVRKDYRRERARRAQLVPPDELARLACSTPDPSPFDGAGNDHERAAANLEQLVGRCLRSGAISPISVEVLWRTRITGQDDHTAAAEMGFNVAQLRVRRYRAKQRLAERARVLGRAA